jgi:drug/metabolite transporter (DMT)-like permease
MLLQAFLFTAMDALVKLAAERHPTGQIVFFRNLFALLPLYLFIRQAGGFGVLRTNRLAQHITRSLAGVTSMVCLFLAYAYMPLADTMAIATSGPIFLTALSVPFLGEQVGWRRWAAVVVGFVGILIVTRPGSGVFGAAALLPLAGALFYAIAMIQIRKLSSSEPPARIVFYFTIAGMLLGGASLPWQWVTPTPLTLVYLVSIGLVGGLAQMAMTQAFRLAPVSVVGPFDYTGLVFGAIFGYAIWRQVPDRFVWLGAVIIIASGIYILHRETVRRRQAG